MDLVQNVVLKVLMEKIPMRSKHGSPIAMKMRKMCDYVRQTVCKLAPFQENNYIPI